MFTGGWLCNKAAEGKTVDSFMKHTQHMAGVASGHVSVSKSGLLHLNIADGSFLPAHVMHVSGVEGIHHHNQLITSYLFTQHMNILWLFVALVYPYLKNITQYSEGYVLCNSPLQHTPCPAYCAQIVLGSRLLDLCELTSGLTATGAGCFEVNE